MRRKLMTSLSTLAVLSLAATSAFAAGVHISGVTWSLGSVIADGKLTGLDPIPVKVVLTANGTATVVCRDDGRDDDHGHSSSGTSSLSATTSSHSHGGPTSVAVTVSGTKSLNPPYTGGKARFHVETAQPWVSPAQAGCSGHGDGGHVVILSVSWTSTNIMVTDTAPSPTTLASQDYRCTSTATSISCKKVGGHGGGDDDD